MAQSIASPRRASVYPLGYTAPSGIELSQRNSAIDALRLICAFGIVWFHLPLPFGSVALGALHVFTALVVYYGVGQPPVRLMRRLLVPWAIWSGVYGILKVADAWVGGQGLATEFAPWMLMTGPALHLWFLPFALVFVVLCSGIPLTVARWLLIPVTVVSLGAVNLNALPVPVVQWVTVLPAAWLGLVMRQEGGALPAFLVAGIAVLAALANLPVAALALAVGATVLGVVFVLPVCSIPGVATGASLALGLYLAHPLVISVGLRLGVSDPIELFLTAVIGALALTCILKRWGAVAV